MDYSADFNMVRVTMVSLEECHLKVISSNQRTNAMTTLFSRFLRDETGVTAIEYGLIAALISVVCIAAMTAPGQSLLAVYNAIGAALQAALAAG